MARSIAALLAAASAQLAELSDSARLDAEVLLAHALGKPRAYLHTWPERTPAPAAIRAFAALHARRLAGEPIAYIIGQREFWSLNLAINPNTLIPRPETELLVELALARLPHDRFCTVADLGTGSGAIALALAHERGNARVIATDTSWEALALARRNAEHLSLANIDLRHGDWYEALHGERCALIVSNPPYITSGDPHLKRGDVRYEPRLALDGGADGLDAIRAIVACAPAHLEPGGWLLLEHGHDQGERVPELLRAAGFLDVSDHRDGAGWARVSTARV